MGYNSHTMPASRKKPEVAAPKEPLTYEKVLEMESQVESFTSGRSKPKRNEAPRETAIKFATWFVVKAIEDTRLKAHRLNEVRAFMTSQGLSASEPRWRYEAALRSYFGT